MLLVAAAVTGGMGIASAGCGDSHADTEGFIGDDGGAPYDGEGQTGISDAPYEDVQRDATSADGPLDAPTDAPDDGGDGG